MGEPSPVDISEYPVHFRIYCYGAAALVPWWLYWPMAAGDCVGARGLRRAETRWTRLVGYIFNGHRSAGPCTGAVLMVGAEPVETYCVPLDWAASMRRHLHTLERWDR